MKMASACSNPDDVEVVVDETMSRVPGKKLRRLALGVVALVVVHLLAKHLLSSTSSPEEQHVFPLLTALEQQLPNLPVSYWQRHQYQAKRSCAPLPSLFELDFNNVYWQTVQVHKGGVIGQLFSAYYDARAVDASTPVLRLVGMANRSNLTGDLHCQVWLEGQQSPLVVRVKESTLLWRNKWKSGGLTDYHPYLITCVLPEALAQIPSAVSLVNKPCDLATNLLKVTYQPPTDKYSFAVCVKGLDYLEYDNSVRLVEWIELQRLLGADKIVFYQLQVHPQMEKVLKFYQHQGLVEVIPTTVPGNQPTHPILLHLYLQHNKVRKRFNEIVTFNDCFYRNFHLFEFILVLDIDEVMMPVNGVRTWREMVDAVRAEPKWSNRTYASFYAQHVYFFDDNLDKSLAPGISDHLFMTQHVVRAANFTAPLKFVKSFLDTERVIAVHNHLPLACKGGKHCWYPIPTSLGRLHHYRKDCDNSVRRECEGYKNNSILDTHIWRYKHELTYKTLSVIEMLRLG